MALVTEAPLSYSEGLFPNKYQSAKPRKQVERPNELYCALRNVEFEPPFYMSLEDVKLPVTQFDRAMIEDEENEKAVQKTRMLERGTEGEELMKQYYRGELQKKSDENKRNYEAKVKKDLEAQGITLSDEKLQELVTTKIADKTVNDVMAHPAQAQETPATAENVAQARTHIEDDLSQIFGSQLTQGGGLYMTANAALPTSAATAGTSTSGMAPIDNDTELQEALFGRSSKPSPQAQLAGIRQREDDDVLAPLSASGFVAPTVRSGVSFKPQDSVLQSGFSQLYESVFEDDIKNKKARDHYEKKLKQKALAAIKDEAEGVRGDMEFADLFRKGHLKKKAFEALKRERAMGRVDEALAQSHYRRRQPLAKPEINVRSLFDALKANRDEMKADPLYHSHAAQLGEQPITKLKGQFKGIPDKYKGMQRVYDRSSKKYIMVPNTYSNFASGLTKPQIIRHLAKAEQSVRQYGV